MSNLCRVSGESIQFVNNTHDGKGGKGGTESLRELTAGAEKLKVLNKTVIVSYKTNSSTWNYVWFH